ncbi:hypothetical protein HLB23_09030 [Nocardia uniformis]|uniref:Uncharacterized protein n=1 Tax=Nocardia uniformis TaxID=53432 RepID=A0A849BUY8_9NOCA|nr:hypothetical protein [Nocardia uniformis]NNH70004.1 hypothetical protein [Nocardia uniformis]
MSLLTVARIAAIPVSVWLIAALTFNADYRMDNIFAVPDFSFSLVLLVAAFLPRRFAEPALMAGFYFGSGVITIAALNRLDQGETGQTVLNLAIAATYLALALSLTVASGRMRTGEAHDVGVPA